MNKLFISHNEINKWINYLYHIYINNIFFNYLILIIILLINNNKQSIKIYE